MDKLIVILVLVGVVFLAGSAVAWKVDLSTGPRAEGQLALDTAEAASIDQQTAARESSDAEVLRDEITVNDATRIDRVNAAHWLWGTVKIFGSIALALGLVLFVINAMTFLGVINYRFAVMPVGVRNGVQVAWTLPLTPYQLVLTNDDAPLGSTLFRPNQQPVLTEPRDTVGLALARVLQDTPVATKQERMFVGQQLSDMLLGNRRKELPSVVSTEQ